ncbi:hypothetical protein C8F04DRAFT_1308900 [Mycena alexandri]|uniref:Uncharacterized protein n=1 Tax=Mycena alexandri TaxID=1745969 RepID=A0AAD6TLL7_9AGAR|nr:hypothetical protein C8F04DRAFT_1308900 [Mycena alexandri]
MIVGVGFGGGGGGWPGLCASGTLDSTWTRTRIRDLDLDSASGSGLRDGFFPRASQTRTGERKKENASPWLKRVIGGGSGSEEEAGIASTRSTSQSRENPEGGKRVRVMQRRENVRRLPTFPSTRGESNAPVRERVSRTNAMWSEYARFRAYSALRLGPPCQPSRQAQTHNFAIHTHSANAISAFNPRMTRTDEAISPWKPRHATRLNAKLEARSSKEERLIRARGATSRGWCTTRTSNSKRSVFFPPALHVYTYSDNATRLAIGSRRAFPSPGVPLRAEKWRGAQVEAPVGGRTGGANAGVPVRAGASATHPMKGNSDDVLGRTTHISVRDTDSEGEAAARSRASVNYLFNKAEGELQKI